MLPRRRLPQLFRSGGSTRWLWTPVPRVVLVWCAAVAHDGERATFVFVQAEDET